MNCDVDHPNAARRRHHESSGSKTPFLPIAETASPSIFRIVRGLKFNLGVKYGHLSPFPAAARAYVEETDLPDQQFDNRQRVR